MKQKLFIKLKLILLASLIIMVFDTFLAPITFLSFPNSNIPIALLIYYGIIEFCCLFILLVNLISFQYLKLYLGIITGLSTFFLYFAFVFLNDLKFISLMTNPSFKVPFSIYVFLFPLSALISIIIVNALTLKDKIQEKNKDISKIKRIVIDFGTKFTRLTLGDICEKCEENKSTVLNVINEMIENKEIHAKYFKSTQMIAFDQQTNLNEIDELLSLYEEWEQTQHRKKK